jgi:acetyl-CoA acetyltransferase
MTEKTTVPTEQEQIERALKAIEEFDPSQHEMEDASDLRAIAQAADAIKSAEYDLRVAVEVARKLRGRSWGLIAGMLGVSRQAARQRFDQHVDQK